MRIAEIAPPWFPVPPPGYGGVELVVAQLAEGLTRKGHDVVLFANGMSQTSATLRTISAELPDPTLVGDPWLDAHHALSAYLAIRDDEFDVVHDHSGVTGPALGALVDTGPPVVHTMHGPWTDLTRRYYEVVAPRLHLVAISDAQRGANRDVPYAGLVHNGIDTSLYSYQEHKEDFLLFIGRSTPDKGPELAIEVARRSATPLVMVVKKAEPPEQRYWDEVVAPALHDDVEVLEDISHEHKADLLARARALVFPIQWPEPFGLVMVEAMASGTPVIACPAGAAVEIVDEPTTGFLRTSVDELAQCVAEVRRCSPAACRSRVEARFSTTSMVEGYEAIFEAVTRPHQTTSGFPLRR
jgi:glycosyltransferase involved in cell wall biosynthesis